MCGRYRLSRRKQIIEEHFDGISGEEDWAPRYNIAPTQPVPVIRQHPKEPRRELSLVRWGLIPWWAKDASGAARMINARSETAGIPVERIVDLIYALETWGETVRCTPEIRHPNRVVDDAKGTAEDDLGPGVIGEADLRSEVGGVLVLFETVATTIGKDQLARNAVGSQVLARTTV